MNLQIGTVSTTACPGAIYRALVVDVDTVLCFFANFQRSCYLRI